MCPARSRRYGIWHVTKYFPRNAEAIRHPSTSGVPVLTIPPPAITRPGPRRARRLLLTYLMSLVILFSSAAGCDPGKIVGDIVGDLQARISAVVSQASTE